MKVLVIDADCPEQDRLLRLLDAAGRRSPLEGAGGILDLLEQRAPGELVLLQAEQAPGRPVRQRLCARVRGGLQQVPVGEVRYFLAEHKYVWVRTPQTRLLIRDSLQSLAREFAGRFVRIHRNALVATRYLSGLAIAGGGQCRVSLAGIDETLTVSRRRLATVRRMLMEGRGNPLISTTAVIAGGARQSLSRGLR